MLMQTVTEQAYAKINVFLEIAGTDERGYHLLDSVMQSVSLCDTVTLARAKEPGVHLTCSDPAVPIGEKNIATRAANLFLQEAGMSDLGVEIHIDKRIPMEAGLAGGSTDAAAVLRGLNRLFETGWTAGRLCELGLCLGADVPFCVRGGAMRARGVGEQLVPVPALPDCFLVLAKPGEGVSTKDAYTRYDALANPPRPGIERMLRGLADGDLHGIAAALFNSLEEVAGLSSVARIEQAMRDQGACGALMTGSGSCVFGIFEREQRARQCAQALVKAYPFACVAQPAPAYDLEK